MEALTNTASGQGAFVIELPYPPSVNHYWRHVGDRTLISRAGRVFRRRVVARLARRTAEPMSGRVAVHVIAHPPDHRRRDLDNTMKALLDALGQGGAYEDDGQIDRLEIERGAVVPGGKVVVRVSPITKAMEVNQ